MLLSSHFGIVECNKDNGIDSHAASMKIGPNSHHDQHSVVVQHQRQTQGNETAIDANFICNLDDNACRCSQRGKEGRRMHRVTLGFYCRETCIFPEWQPIRGRFGWRCGGCDGRKT